MDGYGGGGGGRGRGGGGGRTRYRQDDMEEYAPRRKLQGQRPADFYSPAIRHVQTRLLPGPGGSRRLMPHDFHVPPHEYYTKDLLPAQETRFNPSTALCTQWISTSYHPDGRFGRVRVPLCDLAWAASGRRLLASTSRGEFLLFNGQSFGLEVKTVAHEDGRACRALAWGSRSDLILSGDDAGKVKLWLSNMVIVAELHSNHRAVREMSWAPLETKFCTAGQDGTARVWDTARVGSGQGDAREEAKLEGHGGDVTTVQWHPYRALIATGSQDTQCRLWDPRTAARGSIAALQGHSQALTKVRWSPDGRSLLTAARDGTVRLWDLRQAHQERVRFRGHSESVTSIAWHPHHADLFASAGSDGAILYWVVAEGDGAQETTNGVREVVRDAAIIEAAHEKFREKANPVHTIAWSSLGNVLASCGNEVKYWGRNKPGALEERERGTEGDILDDEATAP